MKSPTLTVLALTSGNILGPLVLFGGTGWYLTNLYESKAYVLIGIIVAFLFSNCLIITTTSTYLRSSIKKHVSK